MLLPDLRTSSEITWSLLEDHTTRTATVPSPLLPQIACLLRCALANDSLWDTIEDQERAEELLFKYEASIV